MAKKKQNRTAPQELALPRGGVDTHAHLSFPEYAPGTAEPGMELEQVIARAEESGLANIGNIFADSKRWQEEKELFNPFPQVFFQLGVHPTEADLLTPEELDCIAQAVERDSRIKAVGEIGLDYYWPDQPAHLQKQVFTAQLRLARQLDLPVSIHSRDAWSDTVAILEAEGFAGRPLLWHCFGGDAAMAEAILERGWHISIPGPVTFKKNEALREAVACIPLERIHLETDSPYLAPEPWRGRLNEPALVVFTAREVAACKGMSAEELWLAAGENSKAFFGL
ncbi:MAG: TatD family hydrolase [Desulfovibrionaceae bacterium]|nr:TatD family hydrolase [Desulfovibrionaceae bacterium]